jgi:sirohydrochlorin cobaltochelatase
VRQATGRTIRTSLFKYWKMKTMTPHSNGKQELQRLEARIRTMLPPIYQLTYEDVQPVSMGSASLKYDEEGRVAWNEIWGSFCDLAMGGGPPHRGTLLQPGTIADIDRQPGQYQQVTTEICRGVTLVTGLYARPSSIPGWIRVDCTSAAMAAWLGRAIVMENVSARFEGLALGLPAGPTYRLEKEIKNVVTAMAKTSHYWLEHMSYEQHGDIGNLLREMELESPFLQPSYADHQVEGETRNTVFAHVAESILSCCGLRASTDQDVRWLGIERENVRSAIWMMRTLSASNVLARREGTFVFVPINPSIDPQGETTAKIIERAHQLEKQIRETTVLAPSEIAGFRLGNDSEFDKGEPSQRIVLSSQAMAGSIDTGTKTQ